MSSLLIFALIWGVYLIVPVIVDGLDSARRLLIVKRNRASPGKDGSSTPWDDTCDAREWPLVTVIIPCHNEAAVIDRCLTSVKNQDYPADRLEVIVVDDGSTDETTERVEQHVNGNGAATPLRVRSQRIAVGQFGGKLMLVKREHEGKSEALNAGIARSKGEIIVNIDSDVVLAPDAVRNIARAFLDDSELDAATGNIQIDWDLIEARDEQGRIVVDENGEIVPRRLGFVERLLAHCQFLEYLASFDLGRQAQAVTGRMYTLAGACSAYRRRMVDAGVRYSSLSVSEDTALTFDLHRRGAKIGFVADANVHIEPVVDLDSLYGQRVRWARGQIEVCGLNRDLIGKRDLLFGLLTVPKLLVFDHTLAFPRLVWGPLFLFFPLIGYPIRTIVAASIAMYLFYVLIELAHLLSSYPVSDEWVRARIKESAWSTLAMPIFRLVIFYYRLSGYLVTLRDEQEWSAAGPLQTVRSDLERLKLRSLQLGTLLGPGGLRRVGTAGRVLRRPGLAGPLALLAAIIGFWKAQR